NLAGMRRQFFRAPCEQECRRVMRDNRHQHRRWTERLAGEDVRHVLRDLMIALLFGELFERSGRFQIRRRPERQPFLGARHEAAQRYRNLRRRFGLVHAIPAMVVSGAMAKNSPAEQTPNILLPSCSRTSPSATRSKNKARVAFAHKSRRTCK